MTEEQESDKERGNPGRRSPAEVAKDHSYEKVAEIDGGTWPASILYVVRHKRTGNLWACLYAIMTDSSDYDVRQLWFEVEEKQVTVTRYEHKEK